MAFVPDIRQLRSFVALAESGTFTGAAKELGLTQSAVSHSVKSLEETLKTILVDRQGKKVVLTREGELMYRTGARVMRELHEGMSEIEGLQKWGQGRIRVGMTSALCHHLLPTVLREFRDSFPHCDVQVETADTAVLVEMIERGTIDFALGLDLGGTRRMQFSPIFEDSLVIAVAPTHPWAGGKIEIDENNIRHQLILYSRQSETYRLVNEFFEGLGARLRTPMVLGDMEAIKALALSGVGGGVIAPWVAQEELEKSKLIALPFRNPSIKRTWGVYTKTRRELSLIEETFVGVCELSGKNLGLYRAPGQEA